jgi:tRNA (guanine-N7-)-methyltransferase
MAWTNIRLYDDDATQVLDWLPDACLDRIDLLYPDPWPKMKHWKRRFVSTVNLDRFARVLKPGGRFCFASDIDTYVNWTLTHIAAHPQFEWTARNSRDWREPWSGMARHPLRGQGDPRRPHAGLSRIR